MRSDLKTPAFIRKLAKEKSFGHATMSEQQLNDEHNRQLKALEDKTHSKEKLCNPQLQKHRTVVSNRNGN